MYIEYRDKGAGTMHRDLCHADRDDLAQQTAEPEQVVPIQTTQPACSLDHQKVSPKIDLPFREKDISHVQSDFISSPQSQSLNQIKWLILSTPVITGVALTQLTVA